MKKKYQQNYVPVDDLIKDYEKVKSLLTKENYVQEYLKIMDRFPHPSFQYTITKSFIIFVYQRFGDAEFQIAHQKLDEFIRKGIKGLKINRKKYTPLIPGFMRKKRKKIKSPKIRNTWSGHKFVPKPIYNLPRE